MHSLNLQERSNIFCLQQVAQNFCNVVLQALLGELGNLLRPGSGGKLFGGSDGLGEQLAGGVFNLLLQVFIRGLEIGLDIVHGLEPQIFPQLQLLVQTKTKLVHLGTKVIDGFPSVIV